MNKFWVIFVIITLIFLGLNECHWREWNRKDLAWFEGCEQDIRGPFIEYQHLDDRELVEEPILTKPGKYLARVERVKDNSDFAGDNEITLCRSDYCSENDPVCKDFEPCPDVPIDPDPPLNFVVENPN